MRKLLGFVLLAPVVLVLAAWATLALHYCLSPWAAAAFPLLAAAGFVRFRWRAVPWFFLAFLAVLVWVLSIEPRNDRDWRVELAILPCAEFDGGKVTVRNIRNFDYRSEEDFDVRYDDKTFDLDQLDTMDVVFSYWGLEEAAHTMLSFGFAGKDYLALSVEIRREKGEDWGGRQQLHDVDRRAHQRDLARARPLDARPPDERLPARAVLPARHDPQRRALRGAPAPPKRDRGREEQRPGARLLPADPRRVPLIGQRRTAAASAPKNSTT